MAKNKKAFVCGDPHFSHRGITQFLTYDGKPVRPWDTPEEMDEALVENWNTAVGEFDRVYVLGDVVINKRALPILGRLHGKKVLICGNHDIAGAKAYLEYFEDVRAYKVVEGGSEGPRAILSHIPIHADCVGRYRKNCHGHLHSNRVMLGDKPDPRYICVSMEQINYTPVLLEAVLAASDPETVS